MGLEIDRERFAPRDFIRFEERLRCSLGVLEEMLGRPSFGLGPSSLGAELEVALTDQAGRPLPLNEEVLRETLDERMTVELDRFNLECNLRHVDLAGRPFAHLRSECESARRELERAAAVHGGRVVMIGILPTLEAADLGSSAMTSATRYRALSHALRGKKQGPFQLDIQGEDSLRIDAEDVTFEGAATSFQVHLRVPPSEFAAVFNATQLATAPVLAAAGNSPTFLGHRLWEETRVALFKQAVDHRSEAERQAKRPARVSFGSGWLRGGPFELFREAVDDYPALLPVTYEEDPVAALAAGTVPNLKEIRLHQGTVWQWNRPVYDAHEGGHVRIELRALPSGPTIEDMLANTAFLIGLSLGLAPAMQSIQTSFDFEKAHHNFYRAAQSGIDAQLVWPREVGGGDGPRSLRQLLPQLAEIARAGLRSAEIESTETDPLIDHILERVEVGQTGSSWQRASLAHHAVGRPTAETYRRMLEDYSVRSADGQPVHRWSVA